jgi:hypothetical protein
VFLFCSLTLPPLLPLLPLLLVARRPTRPRLDSTLQATALPYRRLA